MQKNVSFRYNNKSFRISVKECKGLGKAFGLMFKSRKNAKPLLFRFDKPTLARIHSLFVFFPFVAVWLDGKNRVVDIKEVKPFTFAVNSRKLFKKLIEIPLAEKYYQIARLLISRR